jgi:Skp family chaperone for outer membrane proteins
MDSRKIITIIALTAAVSLFVGYDHGIASSKPQIAPAKVAVVNIDSIFVKSKKHAQWKQKMEEKDSSVRAEMQKAAAEIDLLRKDMDTRKVGSEDYLKLAREGAQKKAMLEANEKYYEQEINLKIQQWTETIYKEVISAIEKVAKERNLDVVLASEELNDISSRELMSFIRTSKVLYHNKQLDITADVLAVLDAAK